MNLKCTIPCIPYLAKFLYKKERLEVGSRIDLNHASGDIPYVLSNLLTGKIQADHYSADDFPEEKYTMDVNFSIAPRKLNYGKITVGEDAVRVFNSFIRKNLHEILMDRIMQGRKLKPKVKEKDIIYAFIIEFEIGDDISFDALKKYQQRLRKDRENGLFRQQSCLEAA